MTSSAAALLSTPTVSNAKPIVKQDDRDDNEKISRTKDKDRVKEKDDSKEARKADHKDKDFESELDNASSTTLATPLVASVMVTPAPDLMASQINVSLLPAETMEAASLSTDAQMVQPVAVPAPVVPQPVVTAAVDDVAATTISTTTTTTAHDAAPTPAPESEVIALSSSDMKRLIDALNRTDTLETAGLRIIPSEANKTAIQNALTTNPELLTKPDAIVSLMANLQTKPANGIAKGIDIRLEKSTELNLYAMADTADAADVDLPEAVTPVSTTASNENADDGVTTETSFDDVLVSALSTNGSTTAASQQSNLGLTIAGTIAPGHNATPAATGQNPHVTLPQGAAQAVAAVIDKYVKDEKTGAQTISLRLDPAELGRMDVRMEYKKGDPLKVHLVVEKADTMNMFLRDQSALENALNQAGLKSDAVSLSFEHNQNAFDHAMNDHNSRDQSDNQAASAGRVEKTDLMAEIDELAQRNLDLYIDSHGLTRYNARV